MLCAEQGMTGPDYAFLFVIVAVTAMAFWVIYIVSRDE